MEELIEALKEQGMDIRVLDVALIWLAWKVHKELFFPLKDFLEEYTKRLREGHLGHDEIVNALHELRKE